MTASTLAGGVSRPAPTKPFPPNHPWDRNFFLAWVALIWFGILGGFVPEMVQHVARHEKAFPLVVHVHGAIFVSWLVLLSAQVLLIRTRNVALHRKLGFVMAGLAFTVVGIGVATALTMDRIHMADPKPDPGFLAVQIEDLIAFALMAGSGVLLRAKAAAHKRLMLLSTLAIVDAGYARFLGDTIDHAFGKSFWAHDAHLYVGADLLVLGVCAYDLITRRRLHPASIAGAVVIIGGHVLVIWLMGQPAWTAFSTQVIGR